MSTLQTDNSQHEGRLRTDDSRDDSPPPAYECSTTTFVHQLARMPPIPRHQHDPTTSLRFEFAGRSPTRWEAVFDVYAADVPALMRQGFYVTKENVRESKNSFTASLSETNKRHGWTKGRNYYLEHNSSFTWGGRWHGYLTVFANDLSTLSNFRIEHLTVEAIQLAEAWNRQGEPVYAFHCEYPNQSWNAIYDDMPMKGLWPWPRDSKADSPTEKGMWEGLCIVQ
ncbi:hypothetical protein CDD80_1672 [Ophiocordyceps camponoti-rufipedis]|uniref:Uncharacterized protein n=1 Tax=Ophiocordyceps camponoti-rufipedis TaxID=2004952 RepID=A0A2C5XYT0_9HYPO|nr:hypothetical protein CDD80_1672 [Ophiocordyceps camponoti-rufipedis]